MIAPSVEAQMLKKEVFFEKRKQRKRRRVRLGELKRERNYVRGRKRRRKREEMG